MTLESAIDFTIWLGDAQDYLHTTTHQNDNTPLVVPLYSNTHRKNGVSIDGLIQLIVLGQFHRREHVILSTKLQFQPISRGVLSSYYCRHCQQITCRKTRGNIWLCSCIHVRMYGLIISCKKIWSQKKSTLSSLFFIWLKHLKCTEILGYKAGAHMLNGTMVPFAISE